MNDENVKEDLILNKYTVCIGDENILILAEDFLVGNFDNQLSFIVQNEDVAVFKEWNYVVKQSALSFET